MLGWPLPGIFTDHTHSMTLALTELVLLIPIAYVNDAYFINGFKSLALGAPTMDALIAVGATASIAWSLYAMFIMADQLAAGQVHEAMMTSMDNLYFESAGTILSLVTVGKYLETRNKSKTGGAIEALDRPGAQDRDRRGRGRQRGHRRRRQYPSRPGPACAPRRVHPCRWRGARGQLGRGRERAHRRVHPRGKDRRRHRQRRHCQPHRLVYLPCHTRGRRHVARQDYPARRGRQRHQGAYRPHGRQSRRRVRARGVR